MKKLKYAALVVAALCATRAAEAANVQRERLDKLNGKALGRVIYRGATLIDGTRRAARRHGHHRQGRPHRSRLPAAG
jgi:hypothetical protein